MHRKQNWYKSFFNEDYFKFWSPTFSTQRSKKETDFIIRQLKLKKGEKILDAPCGQGRHARELSKKGFKIVGIDYSEFLLNEAKKYCDDLTKKPEFLLQDIRKIDFTNKFKAILNLFTSFGYFSDKDNEKIIENFSKALMDGGCLFLDLLNPFYIFNKMENKPKKIICDGFIKISRISDINPLTMTACLEWIIYQNNQQKKLEAFIRLYTLPEIKALLSKHNFKIQKIFGDYRGNDYSLNSSRMIIIAKK